MYSTTATVGKSVKSELMRRTYEQADDIDRYHAEVYKAIATMEKGIKALYMLNEKGECVPVEITTRQHTLDSEVVLKKDTVVVSV